MTDRPYAGPQIPTNPTHDLEALDMQAHVQVSTIRPPHVISHHHHVSELAAAWAWWLVSRAERHADAETKGHKLSRQGVWSGGEEREGEGSRETSLYREGGGLLDSPKI
jgi:hypothetical protein